MTAIKFLKLKLETIESRIAASSDYREMKMLKRLIEEYTNSKEGKVEVEKPKKRKHTKRQRFTKDFDNSPAAHLPRGKRIAFIYDLVEKIAREHGDEIELNELVSILKKEHHLAWKDLAKNNVEKKGRISTYIGLYNKKNPQEQTLELFPSSIKPGHTRIGKYTKVLVLQKERVANAS